MIEDLLIFMQWGNYGHLFLALIISALVIGITVYKVYFKEKIIEGNWFRRAARSVSRAVSGAVSAVGGVVKSLDPTKFINSAIKSVSDFFKDLFKTMLAPIDDIFDSMTKDLKTMNKRLKSLPNSMNNILSDVVDDLKSALDAMKKVIMAPMAGIDTMIANFKRLMCFFETVPQRVNNIMTGMDNVFQGIEEQYALILKAAAMGAKETNKLLNYSVIFINMYFKCAVKFVLNLYKCFFYYMVDAFIRFLFLPIKLLLVVFSKFINFDPNAIETKIWKGFEFIDMIVYSTLDFHIIYFPKSVREDCYTCVTLKAKVVKDQGNVVDKTFKKDMPELVNGNNKDVGVAKIRRGRNQFNEASAMPRSRPPEQVK